MKTIVSSKNPDLARDFARDLLRRRDLRLVTGTNTREIVERLHEGAHLCFLDRVLPDGDAQSACDTIRADRRLAGIPVVLVTDGARAPVSPIEARTKGFSDVVELPTSPGALSLLVGRLLGVPLRDGERFSVRVHVYGSQPSGEGHAPPEYVGTSVDLSEVGMLVKAKRALPAGTPLELRFALPGQDAELALRATVVRVDEDAFAPAHGLAITFDSLEGAQRDALRTFLGDLLGGLPFRWSVTREGARQVVQLSGSLQTDSDLVPLEQLRGPLDFRMRELRRIGPETVQRWMEFLRRLADVPEVRLHECPVGFVQQANLVPNLLDGVEVVSFYAPYACARCGLDDERLVDAVRDLPPRTPPRAPVVACRACGGPMTFDDLPERYFAFLDRR